MYKQAVLFILIAGWLAIAPRTTNVIGDPPPVLTERNRLSA